MQLTRVGLIAQLFKRLAFLLGGGIGGTEALEGCLCCVTVQTRSAGLVRGEDNIFLHQAHDRLEEVAVGPRLVVGLVEE